MVGKRYGHGIIISIDTEKNLNYLQIEEKYSILIYYITGEVTGQETNCIKCHRYYNKLK